MSEQIVQQLASRDRSLRRTATRLWQIATTRRMARGVVANPAHLRHRPRVLRARMARDTAHGGERNSAMREHELAGRSTGLSQSERSRRQPARRSRRVRAERALRSRMSPRSALFRARSFGNAFATCGSRTTTFVASVTRRAYFPRARRPKSERLYSRRRLSDRFLLAFLIDLPLACGRGSGTDDPDCIATLSVGDHEKTTARRDTKGDKSLFVERVIGVRACGRQRIPEYRSCFFERDIVPGDVVGRLRPVPF